MQEPRYNFRIVRQNSIHQIRTSERPKQIRHGGAGGMVWVLSWHGTNSIGMCNSPEGVSRERVYQ